MHYTHNMMMMMMVIQARAEYSGRAYSPDHVACWLGVSARRGGIWASDRYLAVSNRVLAGRLCGFRLRSRRRVTDPSILHVDSKHTHP